ncbi:MAG: AzlC family ABC transporter permease [Proteobacteria bacterium]|nr:AzlC family ABC transporter permease [Pseudomonadota bacterium]
MAQTSGFGRVVLKAVLDSLSLPAFILLTTMMGFGSLARSSGFEPEMAALATAFIWGLPGQLAMVELTATGQSLFTIIFACSLANARFFPMVVSFIPAMTRGKTGFLELVFYAQLLSINSWAMCLRQFPEIDPDYRKLYYVVFAHTILGAAIAGTLLGYHASAVMPDTLVLGMIFLSPLFFALVLSAVPQASARASLILGCLVVPPAHLYFPSIDLLITGMVGGSLGFFLGRIPIIRRVLT